uniref:NADH-ubiquinone oxidoreductase chain 6 n=1 Tax=Polydactylus sextarius TaxID=435218 RepID=A0A0U2A2M3_9TELE|nr:NADH dehydrogenase subunit 6 [Polydactylus sextarius]AKE49781.1 NADH dehydrogenase subunit 6 [Polydactylus sextarius]UAD89992.1 NADH dehydrogenase subunit 6 [Polydactylus sextarius]
MSFIMWLVLVGFIVGVIGVASNPSPYFAAFGLVVVAGMGCGMVLEQGGTFLGMVLFLIYLGGMMVVFAYSAALAAEPYPEFWGNLAVGSYLVGYSISVVFLASKFWEDWFESSWASSGETDDFFLFRPDVIGLGVMFSWGGLMLVIGGWVLLLTLFGVLELTRGLARGALRAV